MSERHPALEGQAASESFELLSAERARDFGEPRVHRGQLIFDSRWAGGMLYCAENWSVGLLFWTVWLSLWLPVLTLALWVCAPAWGWTQFELNGHDNLLTVLLVCLCGILLGSLLSLWGTVRWLVALREPAMAASPAPSPDTEAVARYFVVSAELVDLAKSHRRLTVHHGPTGEVTGVDARNDA